MFAGTGLAILALMRMHRAGTTSSFNRSSSLVCDGVFRLSRNPIYLGMLLVLIGFALLLGNLWCLLGLLPLFAGLSFRVIPGEERGLTELFGEQYQHYCQRTRRWF